MLEGRIDPGRAFDFETDLDGIAEAYAAMDERVPSHAALLSELDEVIVELQRRSIERSEVQRQVIDRGVILRPTVSGP